MISAHAFVCASAPARATAYANALARAAANANAHACANACARAHANAIASTCVPRSMRGIKGCKVVAAEKLVSDWMEEYGVEIDYADKWALIARIVSAPLSNSHRSET